MDDLVQFLRDRLADDEQAARAATWDEWDSAHWTARPPQGSYERYIVADHLDDGVVIVTPENADADGVGQHIARHDPARVLREVEAKRQIVDASPVDCPPACRNEHTFSGSCMLRALGPAPARPPFTSESTLHLLALPYADHPDYRDIWRP